MLKLAAIAVLAVGSLNPLAVPAGACEVSGMTVSWGFKESFRSYISGSIAQGQWVVEGDIGYETPAFSFSDGQGFVSPDRSAGEVGFTGSLAFEGHGGILETTLANPRVEFVDPRSATLFLDVTGDTMEEVSVSEDNVAFASVSWGASDVDQVAGIWGVDNATVVLTEAGSKAFGTYPAGEELDPLDFILQASPGCLQEKLSPWGVVGGVAGIAAISSLAALAIVRVRKSRAHGRQ